MYKQNRRFRVWKSLHMEYNECTITQYMKIYGSIHIHCSYELTAYLNNLHFMQVWKYHLCADLLHPWGSEEPHHSLCIVNIPHDNTRMIFLDQVTIFFSAILFNLMEKCVNKWTYLADASHIVLKQIFDEKSEKYWHIRTDKHKP